MWKQLIKLTTTYGKGTRERGKEWICKKPFVQGLQKLIYLDLSTDCFMKISLHSTGPTEQIWIIWNPLYLFFNTPFSEMFAIYGTVFDSYNCTFRDMMWAITRQIKIKGWRQNTPEFWIKNDCPTHLLWCGAEGESETSIFPVQCEGNNLLLLHLICSLNLQQ